MMRAPNERARLYFVLAWFHAIIQERLRYSPLGWSKKYEFNESDLRVACDMLDTWVDNTSMGRTNLPPQKVPWKAMKTLLSQCIYGGKIDNEFDQKLLDAFLSKLFNEKCFDHDYNLVTEPQIHIPDCVRRDQVGKHIDAFIYLDNNVSEVSKFFCVTGVQFSNLNFSRMVSVQISMSFFQIMKI